ncbi:MAG: hypothetical protein P4M15_06475 [Alphaproteobacteria bacterium]|nr:hypothetical protein [Alphaproteobacteria bacterium]
MARNDRLHILENPAMRLPDDAAFFRRKIVEISSTLHNERVWYLAHDLKLHPGAAHLLLTLVDIHDTAERETVWHKAMPDANYSAFRAQLKRLRDSLAPHGIEIANTNAQKNLELSPRGLKKIRPILARFDRASTYVCRTILHTKTLVVTPDSLPPTTEGLRPILAGLYRYIGGWPEHPPIADLPLHASAQIVAAAFAAADERKAGFVSRDLLKKMLYSSEEKEPVYAFETISHFISQIEDALKVRLPLKGNIYETRPLRRFVREPSGRGVEREPT